MLLVKLAPWCKQGTLWFDAALRDLGAALPGVPERFLKLLLANAPASEEEMPASEWAVLRSWGERRPGWRSTGGQSALLVQHPYPGA